MEDTSLSAFDSTTRLAKIGAPRTYCYGVLQGMDVTDEELMTYISESSTMSKSLEEYEGELAVTHRCLGGHLYHI